MSEKTPGYLFAIPDTLLKGGLYIPLPDKVVMPGGAVLVRSDAAEDADIFAQLAASDEIFTTVLMRDHREEATNAILHEMGTLSLIADHRDQGDGTWATVIAGIGRVKTGQPYLVDGSPFPRMDVARVPTTCADEGEARARLKDFTNIAMSLGSEHSELVSALHRYAAEDAEPSLSVDRLAGLVGVTNPSLLQEFLGEVDVMRRLDMLDAQLLEYIARVKGVDAQRGGDDDLD